MKIKGFISILAALTVITGSVSAVPFNAAAEAVSEAEATTEYDFSSSSSTVEKDGVTYSIFKGYAAVNHVSDESIEEFTVPDTINDIPVVGIEWGAFGDCSKIKKLTLGKNVSVMEWYDVAEQTIEEIAVTEDNESFTVVDGILYSKDMKTVVAFPPSASATEITISDEARTIAPYAFISCQKLTKIKVSYNIREIGEGAFAGCISLTDINIPDGVKVINPGTFMGTKALKSIKIPGSVEYMYGEAFRDSGAVENEDGIHYVDRWAVNADKDIERADIRMGTVGTIEGLFVSKNKLKVITVPESVIHLGRYLAFGLYMRVELVEFHCPVIPERTLGCTTIKEIWITDPDCVIEDAAMSLPAYWREPKEAPKEKDNTEENDYTVKHTRVAAASVAANSVQKAVQTALIEIDEDEDDDDYDIAKVVHVNSSVLKEKLEKYMEKVKERNAQNNNLFEYESGYAVAQPVENVYKAPIKIGNPAKYDTIIRGYKGSTAEEYARKKRRIFDAFVPPSVNVGPEIYDEGDVTYWIYGDSVATARLSSEHNETAKDVVIPDEIKGVPVTSFVIGCNFKAGTVKLPATIQFIDDNNDLQYDNTAYYEVSEDNPYLVSVDGIIYSKDMTELIKVPSDYDKTKITVPDSVVKIRTGAFHSLKNVESVELPDGITVISRNAFCGASKLKSINLPDELDIIGDNAFNGCTSLTDVHIPSSVKHIGLNAFCEAPVVEYENGLGYFEGWLVQVDEKANDIVIKDGTEGVASITGHGNITIPGSVTRMSWEMVNSTDKKTVRADVYSHVIDYDAFKNALFLRDIYIYDPECEICAGDQTIRPVHYKAADELVGIQENSTDYRTLAYEIKELDSRPVGKTVIHGYKGSTAEAYAQMYGIEFEELDDTLIYKDGDINGDGQFSVGDIVLMNKYIHGTYTFNEKQFRSADLNGDGSTDIFDIIDFRRKILAE
ncbi:leucine-rich repeat protein [Ruminococcus sp.]|uniref:leucine-rich repeat protein n=1 Tax=Ruminococcus sp. TaxID=41978 RepID=UPI0025FBB211|nr:leucine-rich repeat protein [Ruminococcus sp.]